MFPNVADGKHLLATQNFVLAFFQITIVCFSFYRFFIVPQSKYLFFFALILSLLLFLIALFITNSIELVLMPLFTMKFTLL